MIKPVTQEEWDLVCKFNRDITEEFLNQKHLSPYTLEQYRSALYIFFRWVNENCRNLEVYNLKPRHALAYQNFLIDQQLSGGAIKFKRSVVSSLCGFVELYYSDEDYAKNFRNIFNKNIPGPSTVKKHEKVPLTKVEYEHLINVLKERKEWQILAYLQFSYSSGCRRSESHQLLKEVVTYEKVEGKNYYITHPIRCKGKGREGNVRRLMFDDESMEYLKLWIEKRNGIDGDECPYMFVHDLGDSVKQVNKTTFNYWCKEVISPIIGRRIHPHLIRTTRGTIMSEEEGKDIKTIQKLLGHADSSTTDKFYIVRSDEKTIDDIFA